MRRWWLLIGVLAGACSGGDTVPAAGEERGPCYGNGTCNAGLVCLSELCVTDPGGAGDGGDVRPATDAGAPTDAASPADAGPPVDAGAIVDAGAPEDAAIDPDAGAADSGPGPSDGGSVDPDAGDAPDAALADAGPDAGPDAGGPADSGVRPDAGPMPNCNPVTGAGCPSGGDYCRWDGRVDVRACVPPAGQLQLEQACDPNLQNCAAGLTCLTRPGAAGPECQKVCDLFAGGVSCQTLMGRHPVYDCGAINGSQRYGICNGRGTFCDPLAPMCPANEVCGLDSRGQDTVCAPAGTSQRDRPCSVVANCAVGQGLCIDLGQGSACRLPCDPMQPACGANARCVSLIGRPFGVCLPVDCHPFDRPCPNGSVCSAFGGTVSCRPAGTAGLGAACGAANECAAPGVCVDLGPGPRCEAPCDAMHPCGGAQICVTLTGIGFGVCR